MMPAQSPLTIVMPAYNEIENMTEAINEVQKDVLNVVPEATLIIVDDGSTDGTREVLDRCAESDAQIRVIHQPRAGHGQALITGLKAADGEYIFLLDSDRQIALQDFTHLWQTAQAHDGVFGIRRERHDPLTRIILSRIVRWVIWLLFGVWLADANVPCKLVKRAIWMRARTMLGGKPLTPSLLLAVYVRFLGYDVIEAPVTHRPRLAGTSSIRYWKLIKFCSLAFIQLLQFRWRLARA